MPAAQGLFHQPVTMTFCSEAIVDQRPVNYCATGLHDCDIPQRAQCVYTGGSSYSCACLPGFSGDGRACQGAWVPSFPPGKPQRFLRCGLFSAGHQFALENKKESSSQLPWEGAAGLCCSWNPVVSWGLFSWVKTRPLLIRPA